MRLGVLDIGSNTVHLLIVDAHHGGPPIPAYSEKTALRLAEYLEADGSIDKLGADRLLDAVASAREAAEEHGAVELLAFATSAIREAPNGEELLTRITTETDVTLDVLPGDQEARLTFLAVRRWFGWSAGTILGLDIGGGSLEIALGRDEEPDYATSLPFGAGRMLREHLPNDPPTPDDIKALRRIMLPELAAVRREINRYNPAGLVVGSSKTFRSLAKLTAPDQSPATLARTDLDTLVEQLKPMTVRERAELPGVSEARAPQLLAGALVAQATMTTLEVDQMYISPWALREGIILRRMDILTTPSQPMTGHPLGAQQGKASRLVEPPIYVRLPDANQLTADPKTDIPGPIPPAARS